MQARCPYFDACGGCQHQDVSYEQQLLQKQQMLSTLFHQEVSIRPNPKPYGYRNRMDFIVTHEMLGLKAKGDYSSIVDIPRCDIQNEKLNEVLAILREWIKRHGIKGARPGEFEGFLRFAMLRGDEHQQQLTLTTTGKDYEKEIDELAEKLSIASLVWTIEDKSTEKSVGSHTHKVYGQESIFLHLAGKEFLIDSRTFFQTSPHMASEAIETMKRFVDSETVYDLYCGVGVLGQCLADKVVGVDNNKSNIEQARKNADHNGIQAEYVCSDAAAWMMSQNPETVIVDPPRAGLRMGVHTLLSSKPKRIIYLSCNPKTQARDLASLKRAYDVIHLEGFDFFPHTDHVECLAVLQLKS